MLEFYDHTCLSCGWQDMFNADHVNTAKHGGRDRVSNI
jgi:predicted nucleic-acid-binding Zn-ribbon protein